jgi:hypothetical protein
LSRKQIIALKRLYKIKIADVLIPQRKMKIRVGKDDLLYDKENSIHKIIFGERETFRSCYEEKLNTIGRKRLLSRLNVKFTIASDGRVSSVYSAQSSRMGPESCILNAIKTLLFSAPFSPVNVQFALDFSLGDFDFGSNGLSDYRTPLVREHKTPSDPPDLNLSESRHSEASSFRMPKVFNEFSFGPIPCWTLPEKTRIPGVDDIIIDLSTFVPTLIASSSICLSMAGLTTTAVKMLLAEKYEAAVHFIAFNYKSLSKESAAQNGEFLLAFADILNFRPSNREEIIQVLAANHAFVFFDDRPDLILNRIVEITYPFLG